MLSPTLGDRPRAVEGGPRRQNGVARYESVAVAKQSNSIHY